MGLKQSPRSSTIPQGGSAQRFLSSRWLRAEKLVWVGNLALLALLGYVLWSMLPQRAEAVKPQPVPAPVKARPPVEPLPEALPKVSFLNESPTATAKSAEPAVEAPTQLPLKLVGIIAADNKTMSRAMIEESGKGQNLYHIGQMVAGARIAEIGGNSVVLDVNGRLETLQMSLSSSREAAPEPSNIRQISPGRIGESIKPVAPHSFKVDKQGLMTLVGDYEAVFKAVQDKIKPYDDGKIKGLQINGLEDDSIASFVDLQDGDVITAVNGQNVNNMQKAWQVWQKAGSQPDLDVQIMRGNSPVQMHFSLGS